MKLKEKAKKMKEALPAIYLTMKDKETPTLAKILAGITIGYCLSPIDLIPDFIPVLGLLDDLLFVPFFISLTILLIPKKVWEKNLELSKDLWKNGKPKRWYYAIPILFIWFLILLYLVKIIFFRS